MPRPSCIECGVELEPAPARSDVAKTYVVWLPCPDHPEAGTRYPRAEDGGLFQGVPAAAREKWEAGDPVYWDVTAGEITKLSPREGPPPADPRTFIGFDPLPRRSIH